MQNKLTPKVSALIGIIVLTAVMLLTLTGCMSMGVKMAQAHYRDWGVYDSSVASDQLSEIRFMFVNIKSFNGNSVNWGTRANNQGFVKVPSGTNTFVLDWVEEITRLSGVDYNSVRGSVTYRYTTTTSSLSNIIFPDVEMLPGHIYFVGGGKGADGQLRIWLLDQTYTPCGYYGDVVADPPKESNTPAKFDGTWKNMYDESFEFAGNTWIQKLPPLTGSNTGPNEVRIRGTLTDDGEYITLYATDTSIDGGRWFNIKAMRQAYIWKYALDGNNLQMELPFFMPEMTYTKQ
ncbi:MAG: hypothetical protein FWD26_03065 [Treponema sp.]|nr:hypothetical protein [Treponema sp.]